MPERPEEASGAWPIKYRVKGEHPDYGPVDQPCATLRDAHDFADILRRRGFLDVTVVPVT